MFEKPRPHFTPWKVAITGGRGFIGSNLIDRLLAQGHEVLSFVRPATNQVRPFEIAVKLTDEAKVSEALKHFRPTHVLYLAAVLSPGRRIDDFNQQFESAVAPMISFARVVPETVRAALFAGSCEEYGAGHPPFKETDLLHCFSSYGWAKISSYFAVSYILSQRAVPWIWLRPFLTFGPGQKANLFLPSVIKACLADNELPLTLGEQTRDFVFINDLCRMILEVMAKPEPALGGPINLGSGQPRQLRQIGETIQRMAQGKGKLQWGKLSYRQGEAMEFYSSIARFKSHYGNFQFTEFEKSLLLTMEAQRRELNLPPM